MQVLASEGEDVGCEEERVAASVKAGEERERGRVQDNTPGSVYVFHPAPIHLTLTKSICPQSGWDRSLEHMWWLPKHLPLM